jgi:hypothetical protein
MTNITVRTFDADYNEIVETQTLMQKIKEFDAYQKANPKTAEQLADDEICNKLANAVLNQRTV